MSKEVYNMSVDILKVHPRNTEFFDDISGEEYERFRESIKNEGILSPIIVAPDMTIISGHQRMKAAKDNDIEMVPIIIREDLSNESAKLKALIAANFGRTKNDGAKQRKAIAEYVELCGVKNGEHVSKLSLREKAQISLDDIAKQFGISRANLSRALAIERKLTDDMKELLDTGMIGKNLAADVISTLTTEEQDELIERLGIADRISAGKTEKLKAAEVEKYVNEIKQLESDKRNSEVESRTKISALQRQIQDYESKTRVTNDEIADLRNQKSILERKVKLNEEEARKYNTLKNEIEMLTVQKNELSRKIKSSTELAGLTVRLQRLLEEELAPIKFKRCMETLGEIDACADNLREVLESHKSWLIEMEEIFSDKTGQIIDI